MFTRRAMQMARLVFVDSTRSIDRLRGNGTDRAGTIYDSARTLIQKTHTTKRYPPVGASV